VQITQLQLQSFRCFAQQSFIFTKPLVLLEGDNGSGKTSLLEALYYLCYLRSFRTHSTKEMIGLENEARSFFVKIAVDFNDGREHEIQAGFSAQKRLVKIDQKLVQSYKELIDRYRAVALTEDDLELIKEGPDRRRSLLDQDILLHNPLFVQQLRVYKKVLESRNALLTKGTSEDSFMLWTRQLWERAHEIQQERVAALMRLEQGVNELFLQHFNIERAVSFIYQAKHESLSYKNIDDFIAQKSSLFYQEKLFKKSLFGAHLDDVHIVFKGKSARTFASRGQQKLLVVLIKVAQIIEAAKKGGSLFFLLDDFMTDFDQERLDILVPLLTSLKAQLIFTCPLQESPLKKLLLAADAQTIQL